jgi:hypothetical protein
MIKGYKAMNSDMTCCGFKFTVGETYQTSKISMCSEGFHFCETLFDVYNYYEKSANTIICEIEALGEILKEGDKSVTDKIKIIRRLNDKELLNTWIKRTNSGNWNSGNRNSGDWNSGDWNSGDWNSGDGNSGDGNSGDWNSGDGNSGYFNTFVPVYFFNKPSDLVYTKEFESKIRGLKVKPVLEWIGTSLMTDKEKTDNPTHKTTGGFLRKTERHDFRYLTDEDKKLIKSLPNFDDNIFKQISNGVSLNDDVEVVVNGQTKFISKTKAKELGLID